MRPCIECGELRIPSHTRKSVCSAKCQNIRRERQRQTPGCGACGGRMSYKAATGKATCRSCRTATRRTDPMVGSGWILRQTRFAIYERDAWTCWLCEELVDSDLIGTRDPWRPSLDHVIPRCDGGSDHESNLKIAHMWCNSVRGDGSVRGADFFRAA